MSSFRRLRAVLLLALISGACWGLVAVVLTLIAELVFSGGLAHWSPVLVFLSSGFVGSIAGAAFAVFLGLRHPPTEESDLSPGRAVTLGGLGGVVVLLLLWVFGPGEFEGLAMRSVAGIATMFSACGALTALGIQRVATRAVTSGEQSSTKSIAP